MDFIVKSKINTLMILCEGIGNSNLGNTIGVEEVQKVALFELAKYLMYLASADGSISLAEAEFIAEAIPLFRGWTPAQFKNWVIENNVYSTEFEQTPPTLLPLLVTLDNLIIQSDPDAEDLPEILLSIYRQVGQAFLGCDGETFAEKSDFNTYIGMMHDYIDENGTRERRSLYHTVEYDGHEVGLQISFGTPTIVDSGDDEDDYDEEEDFASDDDFVLDGSCLIAYRGDDDVVIVPDGITEIGEGAFMSNDNIENVRLPESVAVLGESAFCACGNLTEIDLPEGLVEICEHAFRYCKSLTEIRIPSTVRYIGDDAFGICDSIRRISIPASLNDIGNDAFMFCSRLETVTIYGGNKKSYIIKRMKKYFSEDVQLVWEDDTPDASPHLPASADNVPLLPELAPAHLREHLMLALSGVYTTRRDADFVGQPIRMLMDRSKFFEDEEAYELMDRSQFFDDEEAYELMEIPGDTYTLYRDALRLAEVFRLREDLFDPYEDTEAMIHRGMFKNALMFHALRSLAWTVSCIADEEGRPLKSYSFEELQKIGKALEERPVNYDDESYCTGLCGHEDWRVFYVPDAYLESDYVDTVDLRFLCGKENRGGNLISSCVADQHLIDFIRHNEETLVSLQDLREDLIFLLPVMETIHDGFMKNRDRSEPLKGPLTFALTAWCALAVAAKEPFYSEEASDIPETMAGLEGPMSRPYRTNGAPPAPKAPKVPAVSKGDQLDLGGASVIADYQFANNMTLRHLVIPEGVTQIGKQAFYSCMNLETVVLPKSLKKIGEQAFMSCRALRQVEIPEGVEEICDHAFGATNNLKAVQLPDSLLRVDKFIFGMGGNSPYAVAHMSGTLARRLHDQRQNNFSIVLSARGYVIDGVGYNDIKEFVTKQAQAKPQSAVNARMQQTRTEPENEVDVCVQQAQAEQNAARERNMRQRNQINWEIQALTEEMNSLTGIFAGMKRKKLQAQINELKEQLRRL